MLLAVVGQMSAASYEKRARGQDWRDPEKCKTCLPNPIRDAGPFADPGEEAPCQRDGQRGGESYAETRQAHQPHALTRLTEAGGVEADTHLRGADQAGIGSERERTQVANYRVGCFGVIAAGFAFFEMSLQPELLRFWQAFAQRDQLSGFFM